MSARRVRDAGDRVAQDDLAIQSLSQIGMIQLWAGASDRVPGDYLLCDGRSLSASAYPDLFRALGTAFGGGGGSFNVPDLRDQFIVGAGATYVRGASGGAVSQNVPTHAHTGSVTVNPNTDFTNIQQGGGSTIAVADDNHSHTGGVTINAGGAHTVATLPPYTAVFYVIRAI